MFPDYTNLVLHSYEAKRSSNTLSLRLMQPTPAKLKDESEFAYSTRYDRKDERTLALFFGEGVGESGLKAIKRFDTDKFKPLINFLRHETKTTDDKNVELLAWLIDFDQRPFQLGKRYDNDNIESLKDGGKNAEKHMNEEVLNVVSAPVSEVQEEFNLAKSFAGVAHKKLFNFQQRNVILLIAMLILIVVGVYWFEKTKSETTTALTLMTRETCMYWTGDHYKQVSCGETHHDTLIVALDTIKLKHLKKINQPDTITQNSIGAVWYIKINGSIEYFTSDGYYPLDPKRKLRPITGYIVQKYIHAKH